MLRLASAGDFVAAGEALDESWAFFYGVDGKNAPHTVKVGWLVRLIGSFFCICGVPRAVPEAKPWALDPMGREI